MKKYDWKLLWLDWLLLFGAAWAAHSCLDAAYSLHADSGLWLWMLLLSGLFCTLFRLPKPWIAVLAVLGLGLGCVWIFRVELRWSLWQLWQTGLNLIKTYYPNLENTFLITTDLGVIQLTPALMPLSGILIYVLSLFTVWLRTTLPSVLACALYVTPCFFVTAMPDKQPVAAMLMVLCGCLLVLILSGGVRRRAPEEGMTATLWALLPTALMLSLLLILFPRERYKPPITLEQLSRKIEEIGQQINGTPEVGNGFNRSVELRSLGQKSQRRLTVMTVTAEGDVGGYLYLRGAAYDSFDGDRWQLATPPDWTGTGSPLDYQNGAPDQIRLTVETDRELPLIYTPVYAAKVNYPTVFDYYVPNEQATQRYEFAVLTPEFGLTNGARTAQAIYDDAYGNCRWVPQETAEKLLPLLEAQGILPTDDSSTATRLIQVSQVIAYVQDGATYTLNPGTVTGGEDFCYWFLAGEGGKSGYCVHYATVTAALCRTLGIPARYVEGYVTALEYVNDLPQGIGTATVQERQAHAWVEVYLDEFGWVMIDPTPSDGVAQSATPMSRAEGGGPEDETEPLPATTESAQTVPQGTTEPSEPTKPTEPPATEPSNDSEQPQPRPERTQASPLWWLLTLLLIPPLLWLVRVLRQKRRNRREAALYGNTLALWRWRRYVRLCKALRQTPAEALRALAQKARFSQHTLDEGEQAQLASAVTGAAQQIRTLPLGKRLWYSYWLL